MSRHVIETKKSEHAAGKTEIKCSCGADALVKKFDVKGWTSKHLADARHGWV